MKLIASLFAIHTQDERGLDARFWPERAEPRDLPNVPTASIHIYIANCS